MKLLLFLLLSELTFAASPKSGANPDFTKGDSVPEKANHDWNLGAIGARGWIYSNHMDTTEARQVLIQKIEPHSPAHGALEVGDVLLGTGLKPFSTDARIELANAIAQAEATGTLPLICWRKGEIQTLTLKLPLLGSYSATAPFNCAKSKRIFVEGCATLAKQIKANPREGNPITKSLNALALLASGNPEYLPLVRDQVKALSSYSDHLERRSLHSWFYGPITILLAEYTLATGDQQFIPELKRLAQEITEGQSAVGSWGHRFVQANGVLSGYGMMNAPGVPLTTALVLARAAGVSDPKLDEAIAKSTRLLRFYLEKGSIPYGDHHPWIQSHDDNGKNGAAAILFNLLDDAEAATYFSHMSLASHGAERETGHTGNFFNLLWSLPAVALSGQNATGSWMAEYGWYFDLARQHDGTFRHQGPAQSRSDAYRNWDSTGAYLLAYAQPLRKIYLTGKHQNMVPQLDQKSAAQLVADGRHWSPRQKGHPYKDHSEAQLLAGLQSWSPVVRDRSAIALGKMENVNTAAVLALLKKDDLHSQLGGCQAVVALKGKASNAVPQLRELLKSDHLWLQVKAADALAAIGKPAMPAVPDLLALLAKHDKQNDPRGMRNRYLCFALFDHRNGLFRHSFQGVDQTALLKAVQTGLANEDGRARGTLAKVFTNLSEEEIQPLLPAIHKAIAQAAPSGIMFADGVRLSGLELFSKYQIEEGIPHLTEVLGVGRWGLNGRFKRSMDILKTYRGAAKPILPELKDIQGFLKAKRGFSEDKLKLLDETIKLIETDPSPPKLRSLKFGK